MRDKLLEFTSITDAEDRGDRAHNERRPSPPCFGRQCLRIAVGSRRHDAAEPIQKERREHSR